MEFKKNQHDTDSSNSCSSSSGANSFGTSTSSFSIIGSISSICSRTLVVVAVVGNVVFFHLGTIILCELLPASKLGPATCEMRSCKL